MLHYHGHIATITTGGNNCSLLTFPLLPVRPATALLIAGFTRDD